MTCYSCGKEVDRGLFLLIKVGRLPVEAFMCRGCATEVECR